MSQSNQIPTSTDANSAVDRRNGAPVEVSSVIPPNLTVISYAGRGTFGDVYFTIPTFDLALAQAAVTSQIDLAAATDMALQKLIAVKIAYASSDSSSIRSLKNEIKTLQIIRETNQAAKEATAAAVAIEQQAVTEETTEDRTRRPKLTKSEAFFQILDSGVGPLENTHFLITTTLPLICTLDALKPHLLALPEAFTWLLYLEVSKALSWLNETCKPGIAQGDLHWANILIGYQSLDPQVGRALPQVKLIDFGKSVIHGAEEGFMYEEKYKKTVRDDKGHLIGMLDFMLNKIMSGGSARSQDLRGLYRFIQYAAKSRDDEKAMQFHALNQRFKKLAEQNLADVTQADCVDIWNRVMEVTVERRGKIKGKIQKLLQVST